MTYSTILTSKGTTTIPKDIRDALGVKPGMRVLFTRNKDGEVVLERVKTIEEVRTMNKQWLAKRGITPSTDDDIARARESFYKKGLKW